MDHPSATAKPLWSTCLDVEDPGADRYFDFLNETLYAGIGGAAGRVLDLGCARGMLGKALKERQPGTHVTGVEAGRAAADVAATRLDRVICARIEDVDFAAEGLDPGSFDHVVAGDVLEHLNNPWATLVRVRPLLKPTGCLVASIPNVRNLSVLAALTLDGRFDYAREGILDITHLRFFTLESIVAMLRETGFVLEKFAYTLSGELVGLHDRNKDNERVDIVMGRMKLTGITQREMMELCTQQYVVRARVA